LRLDKKKTVQPPEQELAEEFLKRFDQKGNQSIEDTNFWGFHPRVEWIARGSGAALGARYWEPDVLGPVDLMGAAFYSWRRYQLYDFQFGLIPHRGKKIPSKSFEREDVEQLGDVDKEGFSRFKLYVSGRYRDRTDDSFFGRGIDSKREDQVRYRIKDTSVEAVTGYQVGKRFGWTVKAGLIQNSLAPGRSDPTLDPLPPGSAVPGFFTPPNYFRLATSFLFDYRDDPGVPHKGFMLAFGWDRLDNINTFDRFNFNRFAADLRAYIPLGSVQRVIAVRGFLVNSDPGEGNRVPFFLQPSLGGGESLRGYEAFRFQGDKLMLVQAEYRWEASRRLEFALFGDTGTVANQGQRLSVDKLKSDWGIGFRFKTSRATIFRVDQAWGNEGGRTQFRFSAVF
jgi:outer membrane protein assembly factor BamA